MVKCHQKKSPQRHLPYQHVSKLISSKASARQSVSHSMKIPVSMPSTKGLPYSVHRPILVPVGRLQELHQDSYGSTAPIVTSATQQLPMSSYTITLSCPVPYSSSKKILKISLQKLVAHLAPYTI